MPFHIVDKLAESMYFSSKKFLILFVFPFIRNRWEFYVNQSSLVRKISLKKDVFLLFSGSGKFCLFFEFLRSYVDVEIGDNFLSCLWRSLFEDFKNSIDEYKSELRDFQATGRKINDFPKFLCKNWYCGWEDIFVEVHIEHRWASDW